MHSVAKVGHAVPAAYGVIFYAYYRLNHQATFFLVSPTKSADSFASSNKVVPHKQLQPRWFGFVLHTSVETNIQADARAHAVSVLTHVEIHTESLRMRLGRCP